MKNGMIVVLALLVGLVVGAGGIGVGPQEPTLVSGAAVTAATGSNVPCTTATILRLWSDGAVDASFMTMSCFNCPNQASVCAGPFNILPGSCMADVNRDGDVAIKDLLAVLGDWGRCDG